MNLRILFILLTVFGFLFVIEAEVAERNTATFYSDFNGDGFEDILVGVYLEGIAGAKNVGAANAYYGSKKGLTTRKNQFWHPGVLGFQLENNAYFGFSMSAGDINDDGFSDAVYGIPGHNGNRGAVLVQWGSKAGLSKQGALLLDLGAQATTGDFLGTSVYVNDLNGDGLADVAAGAPTKTVNGIPAGGALAVFYSEGMTFKPPVIVTQATAGVKGEPQVEGLFAMSITGGYFAGNDDFYDLAVGVPNHTPGGKVQAGAVYIFPGSSNGVKFRKDRLLLGLAAGDHFGSALAPVPIGKDRDALAIGAPFAQSQRGQVTLIDGKKRRLIFSGEGEGDLAGLSLAGGDVLGDNLYDLAIGAPGRSIGNMIQVGAVYVLEGRPNVQFAPAIRFNSFGFTQRPLDRAGLAVAMVNASGKGADLMYGVPFADAHNIQDSGGFNLINVRKFLDVGFFTQNTPKVKDKSEKKDSSGFSFTVGISRTGKDFD